MCRARAPLGPWVLPLLGCVLACRSEVPADPPGTFAFAVLGDQPYTGFDDRRFERVIEELNADSLAFVIHLGDIFWYPCSDERMRRALAELERIEPPVVYTPGDNEWTDCWEPRMGSHRPLERLARLRSLFFAEPDRSLGGRRMPLETQASEPEWSEFVENRRWLRAGIAFVTVHLVGSRNALDTFPGRGPEDDAEVRRRTEAAVAWVREAFAWAARADARALVVATHAAPDFEAPPEAPDRAPFEAFLRALTGEARAFDGPVVLAHGDDHEFIVDHPLEDPETGDPLRDVTRVEVMGSPDIGWVRVAVDTTAAAGPAFRFAPRRVPWWRLW